MPLVQRRALVDSQPTLSVRRQAELLSIPRSGLYYRPRQASSTDLEVRRAIDEVYTEQPFYGSRKLSLVVSELLGRRINRKQIQRLMRDMGIQAIGPSPSLSKPAKGHEIYPYLLRGRRIIAPNEVWSTDITYIRLNRGFAFLTAVIDWFSRYVLSWRLSNTLDSCGPIEALEEALEAAVPDIFNTDQGSQFTSTAFTEVLKRAGARISMDGKGRALDNVFVERLWRSVKYENVYPRGYETLDEATRGLESYFKFYNAERPHQSLEYKRPKDVYFGAQRSRPGFT